jgi:hypothetical protein
MRAMAVVLTLSVASLLPGSVGGTQHLPSDAAVLLAVIEDSIRPEVTRRRTAAETEVPPIILWEASVPMCAAVRIEPCVPAPHISLETPPPRPVSALFGWTPALPTLDDGARTDLAASFRARNAQSTTLPVLQTHGLELTAHATLRAIDQASNNRQGRVKGYAALSLPGYSKDGVALVHGRFMCGGRCGYTWLLVLRQESSGWRVVSKRVLGMR